MTKFKELFLSNSFQKKLESPSVTITLKDGVTLSLRINSKDVIQDVAFDGKADPWLASMCFILTGMTVGDAEKLTWKQWDEVFKNDQSYWDFKAEVEHNFFQFHLELLHAALDNFRGKESLYFVQSPLICRCFGIRENEIIEHLRQNDVPTLESLSGQTKAGMGCRSCVTQLTRWVAEATPKKFSHYYKERPVSDWLLLIDEKLSTLPEYQDWKLELKSLEKGMVMIEYLKEVSQLEEESLTKKIQGFLEREVDAGLAFFLRRA